MQKTILITGSTDGIGLEAANMLLSSGHKVLIHGRNAQKLKKVTDMLSKRPSDGQVESYLADLSRMKDVVAMAEAISKKHGKLDVLVNNAGTYRSAEFLSEDGMDVRFAINAVAPYLLTKRLLPLLGSSGRVVNLSSAAQAPVNPEAVQCKVRLQDGTAYAQSKLMIIHWSNHLAATLEADGPVIISLNPRSMLGTKMVMDAYGVRGSDLRIGARIICDLALSDDFKDASGKYFDNDAGKISVPYHDALDPLKNEAMVKLMDEVLGKML